jgi:Glycogen debranching enzyme
MSYISFDKKQLVNLEFTLNREILRSNRSGAFSATTLIGCNTRKYHGLLVVPQPQLDVNNHVLLSNIDETIIENKEEFHLGVHMYANNVFAPRGHKYLRDFSAEPIPKLTYQIGSTVFTKELIFVEHEARVMIRYAVVESSAPVTLRVLPFLAFRNVHMLTHENHFANRKFEPSKNGSSWQLYENYSRLFLQFSREVEYTHIPHWYYNMFYIRECERGYDALEDQYVPGFFELPMREGNTVVLSAGLEEANPSAFKRQFNAEVKNRTPRNSFENCLINSAQQFVVKDQNGTRLWAGFPWFGVCSRDTFLSLPGLILTQGDEKSFREALDYLIERMEGPFFPHKYYQNDLYYTAVDSPLWFIWNLQKYEEICGVKKSAIWKKYKNQIITILESYINGADFNVKMQENGLLYAGNQDLALTWMNVFSGERPWTARYGLAIEVNALWYNALKYACDLAGKTVVDKNYVSRWKTAAEKIEKSFPETFYDSAKGQFYDFVNEDEKTPWFAQTC